MRIALGLLFSAACLTISGPLAAQQWEDLGTGSGTPPGIFHLHSFDSTVPLAGHFSADPQLLLGPDLRTSLIFSDIDASGAVSTKHSVAVNWLEGIWQPMRGSGDALMLPGYQTSYNFQGRAAAGGEVLFGTAPGNAPAGFVEDLYAAFQNRGTGWTGQGGSLDAGGLTQVSTFDNQVSAAWPAVSSLSQPFIAFTRGPATQRNLFVLFYQDGAWGGLAGSDMVPVNSDKQEGSDILDPTIGVYQNAPVVAWTERAGTVDAIKVRRYSATSQAWEPMGYVPDPEKPLAAVGYGRNPQVVCPRFEDDFYLAYENAQTARLTVLKWNATDGAFTNMGNPITPWLVSKVATMDDTNGLAAPAFSLALNSDNRPAVAFRTELPLGSGNFQICVSYFAEVDAWFPVGDPDTTSSVTGLEYTVGTPAPRGCYAPSLVFDPANKPILSWVFDDGTGDAPMVLLRRYSVTLGTAPPSGAQLFSEIKSVLKGIIQYPTLSHRYFMDRNEDGILDAADLILLYPSAK